MVGRVDSRDEYDGGGWGIISTHDSFENLP